MRGLESHPRLQSKSRINTGIVHTSQIFELILCYGLPVMEGLNGRATISQSLSATPQTASMPGMSFASGVNARSISVGHRAANSAEIKNRVKVVGGGGREEN